MGKINYYQWLNGGCGCNGVRHISGTNDCDCDQILLEISNLHTDDEVLQDEIDDLSGDVATKLDASAYTPVDLSDYYTKEEVDEKIASGGSGTSITVDDHLDINSTNPAQNKVITEALNDKLDESAYTPTDLSNYYNKTEVNDIITSAITDVEAEIPSLSGYATLQDIPTSNSAFTNDEHFITSGDSIFNNYATTASTANYVTSGNVENQIVNHFWCGTQAEWGQISGNTQPNVLYLVHD